MGRVLNLDGHVSRYPRHGKPHRLVLLHSGYRQPVWIHDNPDKAQKLLFSFNPAGEIIFTFGINLFAGNTDNSVVDSVCEINISKALSNTSSKFFSWLYDVFFGGIPVAESVIDIPKDPPLPPAKN